MESLEKILPVETAASAEKYNTWPMEVRVLVAMMARARLGANRRKHPRNPLRLEMVLQFTDDNGHMTNAALYTRDTSGAILGFITSNPPKPGQQATLKFDDAQGVTRRMPCRVVRCRQVRDGWFEGTLDMTPPGEARGSEGPGLWRRICDLVGA